jgi:hypothetical protein
MTGNRTVPWATLGNRSFYQVQLSEEEAQDLCEEWKPILGLTDWAIRVVVVPKEDMKGQFLDGDFAQGTVQDHVTSRLALIKLVDPADYPDDAMTPQDMELSLVHEMTHILINRLKVPQDGAVVEEQIVDLLAEALVRARRLGIVPAMRPILVDKCA